MAASPAVQIVLTEEDIPGASLDYDKIETYTVAELKWWLKCRDVHPPTSWRKAQLIDKVHQALKDKLPIIDVDCSYLHRKEQKVNSQGVKTLPLSLPGLPLTRWETFAADNYKEKNVPKVSPGLLYTYLSEGCERIAGHGAFCALQRGFVHWASGILGTIEINTRHPSFCHVRCNVTPSMKSGVYHTYLLLGREGKLATIEKATCECAAGESASCTHISGLLHALVAVSHAPFDPMQVTQTDDEDAPLPITSFACQWKAPRKRKEADAKISDVTFEKHVYGRTKKHNTVPIHDFDPRPQEARGTLSSRLPAFLDKVKGKGLGISMIVDPSTQVWSSHTGDLKTSDLPSKHALQERVSVFMQSLRMSAEKIREIERTTKDQHISPQWYSVRRYRLTASKFGEVLHRRADTPPDSLVLRIIEPKQFATAATEWGKRQESVALEHYEQYQRSLGHLQVTVCKAGFVICEEHPFLGATPDAYVHDPSFSEPYGVVEIKCPFKYRDMSPEDACLQPDFCSTLQSQADGTEKVRLKCSHNYFAQVQGHMAITGRHWCHFVLYTKNGLSVETIKFDENFWKTELLPPLDAFYINCVAPEIVCPVHLVGLPIRDLRRCHIN